MEEGKDSSGARFVLPVECVMVEITTFDQIIELSICHIFVSMQRYEGANQTSFSSASAFIFSR